MSVCVHVQINHQVSLGGIAQGSTRALPELLNLRYALPVEAAFEEARPNVSESNCLVGGAPLIVCSIRQAEEAVRVMPFEVPTYEQLATSGWVETGEKLLVSIQPHRSGSNLRWALTAAVAVAIARISSAEVEDVSSFFTTACDGIGADAFVRSLAIIGAFDELGSAADVFYGGMNKSAEVTRWIKAGCPQA